MTLLRRAIAVIAIAAGLGVTAGTVSAAAATPVHQVKIAHVVPVHQHHVGPAPLDWWWL